MLSGIKYDIYITKSQVCHDVPIDLCKKCMGVQCPLKPRKVIFMLLQVSFDISWKRLHCKLFATSVGGAFLSFVYNIFHIWTFCSENVTKMQCIHHTLRSRNLTLQKQQSFEHGTYRICSFWSTNRKYLISSSFGCIQKTTRKTF